MSDRLQEIRARLDAATPGPSPEFVPVYCECGCGGTVGKRLDTRQAERNDLIAHAPADIAWLLDQVERLERLAEHDRKFAPLDPCDCWRCQEADDA